MGLTDFEARDNIIFRKPRGAFLKTLNMGFFKKIIEYFKSSKEEIRKVTWPTREQLIRDTLIVLAVSGFLALFLGGLDYLLTMGLQQLINLKK